MKAFRVLIPVLVLGISAFILFRDSLPAPPWAPQRDSAVFTTLLETGEASLLETAQLHMTLVVPYDFIREDDEVDWDLLRWYYDASPEEFARKSSEAFYPDARLPEGWRYAALYEICRKCGLDPADKSENFIVVSTLCQSGFSFDGDSLLIRQPDEQNSKKINLKLPSPRITDIMVKDRNGGDDDFPDVRLEPEQWSLLIREIHPFIADAARQAGLLDTAREAGEFLVRELFEGAGFEIQEIEFGV